MKRGLLIIDHGSREPDAYDELKIILEKVQLKSKYDYADLCFLEVFPPVLDDVIKKCPMDDLDTLTVVPYFLYHGKKTRTSVKNVMKYQKDTGARFLITKPMSMHPAMVKMVDNKIVDTLQKNNQYTSRAKTDVLIVGHGSRDLNAQLSLNYVVDNLRESYRNVDGCFLEIEQPDIPAGVDICRANNPSVLAIVFYFLHKGAHVKRDVNALLLPALKKSGIKNTHITSHIGVDDIMVDLIIERAREVENAD